LTDKKATKPYDLRMWLELHNPVTPANPYEQMSGIESPSRPVDDQIHGGYRAALKDAAASGTVYRVLLYKVNGAPGAGGPDPMGMRPAAGDNVAGLPTTAQPLTADPMSMQQLALTFDQGTSNGQVVDASGGTVIQPNVGAQYREANPLQSSFYLTGPQLDTQMGMGAAQVPDAKANLTSTQLQTKVEFTDVKGGQLTTWSPGFVLQRLACPALPPGPLNPFVTVDYWESDPIAVGNRLKYDDQGMSFNNMSPGTEPDWNTTYGWGRRQPYDGVIKYTDSQHYRQAPQNVQMGHINFTFGQHNGNNAMPEQNPQANWTPGQTLQSPFVPLAHFDRIALNSTELLQVVAVKPHELAHSYYEQSNGAGAVPTNGLDPSNRLWYTADWLDHAQNLNPVATGGSFLYRALGVLKVPTPLNGLGMGGRVPGKININTIFAPEILDAVCDAPQTVGPLGPNRFGQTDVGNAWNAILMARQGAVGTVQVGPTDRPFVGAATPIDPSGSDRLRTVFRPDMLWPMTAPTAPRNTEAYAPGAATSPPAPGSGHAGALEKYEMLSKVYNQFTTRSNTFAVYMMIGYFEVKNPGPYTETNRPILGKELGTDDGTVVRHKFFSVIDRTNLTIEAPKPTDLVAPGQPVTIKQGQAPVYFSYQPDVQQPSAANNFTVIPDPQTLVQPPAPVTVNIRIPALGLAMNPTTNPPTPIPGVVIGEYDGTPWTISANPAYPQNQLLPAQLVVDIGTRQETATILPNGVIFDQLTNTAVLQIQLSGTQPHDRGAIIRLANPDPTQMSCTPGNPGPQPGFNYKSPRYASVVKYVEQLK
jgi:hypothetical protein